MKAAGKRVCTRLRGEADMWRRQLTCFCRSAARSSRFFFFGGGRVSFTSSLSAWSHIIWNESTARHGHVALNVELEEG